MSTPLALTPRLMLAIRMLELDHRGIVALIEETLAGNEQLVQTAPAEAADAPDVTLSLDHGVHIAVSSTGSYRADAGPGEKDAAFFASSLARRVEILVNATSRLVETHIETLGVERPHPDAITIAALAEAMGLHMSTISRVLSGKVIRFEGKDHSLAELLPVKGV